MIRAAMGAVAASCRSVLLIEWTMERCRPDGPAARDRQDVGATRRSVVQLFPGHYSCRSVLLTSVPRHNQKILPPEGVLV
jgi:hypothetical protein